MALSRGAMGLSAVCDCGISLSYSLTILERTATLATKVLKCSLPVPNVHPREKDLNKSGTYFCIPFKCNVCLYHDVLIFE